MAVYYKFKSAKDFDSIPIDGHFITVGNLKEKIFEYKQLGRGTDFDLVVTNAQTNEGWFDFLLVSLFLSDYNNVQAVDDQYKSFFLQANMFIFFTIV